MYFTTQIVHILPHFEAIHTNISHDITSSVSLSLCFGAYAHILVNFTIQEYDRLNRNISGDVSFIIKNFQTVNSYYLKTLHKN
jgi:hypothetical protein